MGGGMGKAIIEYIKAEIADAKIMAVGTNSSATSVMLKAGADYGATGENAIKVNCKNADYIIGVMEIIIAIMRTSVQASWIMERIRAASSMSMKVSRKGARSFL